MGQGFLYAMVLGSSPLAACGVVLDAFAQRFYGFQMGNGLCIELLLELSCGFLRLFGSINAATCAVIQADVECHTYSEHGKVNE